MGKFAIALGLFALVIIFTKEPDADRHFWYPVKLLHAKCDNFDGDVYKMENSLGWRSWPYYLEKATKSEIELDPNCVLRVRRDLPVHTKEIQNLLTAEQKEYLIEGFN